MECGILITKNWLKRGERSDTYVIHICRLPQSLQSLQRLEKNWNFSQLSLAVEVD